MSKKQERIGPAPFTEYDCPIAARRIELDMTQQQLADAVGVSRCQVTNIENGRTLPRLQDIRLWMDALNLSADELIKALGI